MAHIIELKASNFKRLSAVEVTPQAVGTTVIAGRNGQGKTSLIDALIAALAGKGAIDSVPVKVGADKAKIVAKIDTDPPLVVERIIKPDGNSTLKVSHEIDGNKATLTAPQKVLDTLVGSKFAFDPLAFSRMKPADQMQALKEIVGVDPAAIDLLIAATMEERAANNKLVAQLKSRLQAMPHHDDVGTDEVSTAELLEQLREAEEHNSKLKQVQADAVQLAREIEACRESIEARKSTIAKLQAEIKEQEGLIEASKAKAIECKQILEREEEVDVDPIKQRISGASEHNRKVASNNQRSQVAHELEQAEATVAQQTEQLEGYRKDRLDLMNNADWPLEGLGFGDKGVTYNGLPFDQCSSAERLIVGAKIGLSKDSAIRLMIIQDGSLLDGDSMAKLEEIAIEHDAQVWIERVGTDDPGAIVIEDGTVTKKE